MGVRGKRKCVAKFKELVGGGEGGGTSRGKGKKKRREIGQSPKLRRGNKGNL